MKKIVLSLIIGLGLLATSVNADSTKGQKLYTKKLKKACGFTGRVFATKHTQDEWDLIGVDGMAKEIRTMCPKVKNKALKLKYLKNYFDFVHDFASDSGNIPSC